MHPNEEGPARAPTRDGAADFISSPIVVHRLNEGQPCLCAAIGISPSGEQFVLMDDGTYYHDGQEWRRIADFVAVARFTSLDPPAILVHLAVHRAGKWRPTVVPLDEFHELTWVARCLGADAAASIIDPEALLKAITYISFARSACAGCKHER